MSILYVIETVTTYDYFFSDKSLVVSAPTGSGKTVLLELAIVRLLMVLEELKYTGDFKIVYSKYFQTHFCNKCIKILINCEKLLSYQKQCLFVNSGASKSFVY